MTFKNLLKKMYACNEEAQSASGKYYRKEVTLRRLEACYKKLTEYQVSWLIDQLLYEDAFGYDFSKLTKGRKPKCSLTGCKYTRCLLGGKRPAWSRIKPFIVAIAKKHGAL